MSEPEHREIKGQHVELVTRQCKGCAKTFRVMAKSKQRYHSESCEILSGAKPKDWRPLQYETDED